MTCADVTANGFACSHAQGGRYKVTGFVKDEAAKLGLRTYVVQLKDDHVWSELARRYVDSGL